MRILFATTFLLGLLDPLLGSPKECPAKGEWRNETTTPGGSPVCAKFYVGSSCSGVPVLIGVNSAISDMRHKLEDYYNAEEVTVLIRPLCQVTLWSDTDFKGPKDTSHGYHWSGNTDAVLSAICDCETENVELLTCEPKEEAVLIQQCNCLDMSSGCVCPYSIDTHPFKRNAGSDGSTGRIRNLTPDERETLTSLTGPRIASGMLVHKKAHLGQEGTPKYLMYAPMKPHQALRISQRTILCGSYTMPTTEVQFDYDIAERNTWVLNPAAGRLYYFSKETERETRENAARKCEKLGGRLAILERPEEVDFAARIALKNFNNGTTSWWTAAALGPEVFGTRTHWLRWEGSRTELTGIGFTVRDEDFRCVRTKFVWPSRLEHCSFLAKCETELPFVCEKYPDL